MFNSVNPDMVEVESQTNEIAAAVMILTPAVVYAYNQSPLGLEKSIASFFGLFFAGLFLLILHHKNRIVALKNSLILLDSRHFKPVKIKYKDITGVKLGVGLLEFITLTKSVKVIDINGNTYIVHCVKNSTEIIETMYDILRTVNGNIRVR